MRLVVYPLLAAALIACTRTPAPRPEPAAAVPPCRLLAPGILADSVVIGVPELVEAAHARVPTTEAERFVFGTLYQTLVRLDCSGRPVPGLATTWSVEDSGRRDLNALDVLAARERAQLDHPFACVLDDVARDLRDRGGNA